MPPSKDMPNILRGPGDYEVTSVVHNDTYPEIDPTTQNLEGKSVFITGGSRGLGRAMALSFAKAGVSYVAVGARSDLSQLAKDIKSAALRANRTPPQFLAVKLDVSDPSSVDAAARGIDEAFGKLDILINNAGILGSYGLIHDSDPKHWWQVMEVNLRGPYLVTRACLPVLLKGDVKRIINVTSVGAHLTNPTLSAYQISKLGLVRLSQLSQVEYSTHGIMAFSIHPGNCPTDIMGGPENIPPHHKHGEQQQLGALPRGFWLT